MTCPCPPSPPCSDAAGCVTCHPEARPLSSPKNPVWPLHSLPRPCAGLRCVQHPGADQHCDWLCLDPVRLRFEQRSLIVEDPRQLELTGEESAALAVSLAPTFAGFGHLEVVSPRQWNLRLLAGAPAFQDLPDAAGRAAAPLPAGCRLCAVAPCPQRSADGLACPSGEPGAHRRRAAGGQFALALGRRSPARTWHPYLSSPRTTRSGATTRSPAASPACCRSRAQRCRPSFETAAARKPLAVFDALEQPARSGDAIVWRDELARFEADWLAPALAALRSGRLDALRLIAPGDLGAAEVQVSRHDLWKFWRKPRRAGRTGGAMTQRPASPFATSRRAPPGRSNRAACIRCWRGFTPRAASAVPMNSTRAAARCSPPTGSRAPARRRRCSPTRLPPGAGS